MYYKKQYCDRFVDDNFKYYLRDKKQGTSKKKILADTQNKAPKKCLNTNLISSRAWDGPITIDNSHLVSKYQTSTNSLKTKISMFKEGIVKKPKNNSININRTFTDEIKEIPDFTNYEIKPHAIGQTTSGSKKINFFYGNNPIEVLNVQKQKNLLSNEKARLANRTKQVTCILDSTGVKGAMNTKGAEFNQNITSNGRITCTPKSLLDTMRPETTKFNRKKQTIGFDGVKNSFFYMG